MSPVSKSKKISSPAFD